MKEFIKKHIVAVDLIIINIVAVIASLIQYIGMKDVVIEDEYSYSLFNVDVKKNEYIGYNYPNYIIGLVIFSIGLVFILIHLYHNRENIAKYATTSVTHGFLSLVGAAIMFVLMIDMDERVSKYYDKLIESSFEQNITLYAWPAITLLSFIIVLTIIRKSFESDVEAEKMYYVSAGKGAYNMMAGSDNEGVDEYHYKEIYK